MPITPHFQLSQTLAHVIVEIRVPHVRVSVDSVEILVEDCCLHFSSPPYLLVLTFPYSLLEDAEQECAKYDPCKEGGTITLKLIKKEAVMWPDLDLMGALLTPKKTAGKRAGIEIMSESSLVEEDETESDTEECNNDPLPDILSALRPHYGFLNLHSGVFTDLAREGLAAEMLQLPDPDSTSAEDRRAMRLDKEAEDFDVNRYLGDLNVEDDYIYQTAMDMRPHWRQDNDKFDAVVPLTEQLSELSTEDNIDETHKYFFTPEESAQLASIPYPLFPSTISPQQDESLLLGLLDILFAYVYDHIITDGDPTIESSWTVCILSSTLSWLDLFNVVNGDSLELVVRHSTRRALIYPYLRNHELALYCWNQVSCILRNGRRCIIRCLLQLRNILDKSECYYLGNRLYVDPYLAWIQRHVTDAQVSSVYKRLEGLLKEVNEGRMIQKECLGLNLLEVERQLEEEEVSDDSSESDSDDESSDEEEEPSSDDSTCSSRGDAEKTVLCDDQKLASTELLDSELGYLSVTNGISALKLDVADADVPENKPAPRKLIEEL